MHSTSIDRATLDPCPVAPADPQTFSVLTRYGATSLDAYRPSTTTGPQGWRMASALLELNARALDIDDLRPIGEGALGWVFFSRQRSIGRPIAIKVGKSAFVDPRQDPLRVQGSTMARLVHPSVPRVYAYGQLAPAGPSYLFLEWIDGPDLNAVLRSGSQAPGAPRQRRVLEGLMQVAMAVEFGHQRGELHGDVKPANILLPADTARPAVLVDWNGHEPRGAAGALGDSPAVMGSWDYWDPTRVHAPDLLHSRESDIWALAATLYSALCGVTPLAHHGSAEQRLAALRDGALAWDQRIRPASQVAPQLGARLLAILEKALAEAPEQRYGSAAALAADLQAYLDSCAPDDGATYPRTTPRS
ncbi:MAG: serine/threonine protein kinase [Planctomycetaceae bacterium]|nr:serine/threonine protein kinase [Planctomycetaceae bacterium]